MIYSCEYCKNHHNCSENKEQYTKTCNIISAVIRGIDKLPECHSYYSVVVKCDYWCEDTEALLSTTNSEG